MNNSDKKKKITKYTRKQGTGSENLKKQQKRICKISDTGLIRYRI